MDRKLSRQPMAGSWSLRQRMSPSTQRLHGSSKSTLMEASSGNAHSPALETQQQPRLFLRLTEASWCSDRLLPRLDQAWPSLSSSMLVENLNGEGSTLDRELLRRYSQRVEPPMADR